ncbi:non-ribosomal peptide synthetase [Cupriavidus consociatus]|uniref:non-ribosomal peptide synthetase n=1 Tax=Cupriavidus consociatus TaxID=2821357 RepID=UPI001AE68C4C|nr:MULTISPECIES: non-ribosomal peptide synthetase [unclassified Cupriavidus]MBP0618988.1 amino acid adenylation domain-containing protein [Cupriavidus sp. LEh25]MDK2655633.1 non-ribosomal peptide synthetase [Cupriavidus sp. LEh21]
MTQPDLTIRARAAHGPAPLSFAQQRLWFLQRYAPDGTAYNLVRAWRLHGPLSAPALERALALVTLRHAVLRTRFSAGDGEPCQWIGDAAPAVQWLDLPAGEVDALLRREAARVFDLHAAAPFQVTVARLDDGAHVLVMAMHHIVSDGWSNPILARDLARAYGAALDGTDPGWTPLPVQYADYAAWQRERLAGPALDAALSRCAQRLGTAIPALELPLDAPRPARPAGKGGRIRWTLSDGVVAALRDYCSGTADGGRTTPFAVLLAAWQALLARYSGQYDFAVGVPIAARTHEELDDLIGCFINTQVYRARLAPGLTGRALCQQVRDDARAALDHADLPFELLVDKLAPARDPSRTPVFQAMFNLQMGEAASFALPGLQASALPVPDDSAKFDVTLDLQAGAKRVSATLEYDAVLFAGATAQRMARHYEQLLGTMLATPDVPLDALPLMDAGERANTLASANGTGLALDADDDVVARIARAAAATPDAIAITDGSASLTYAELEAGANRIAHWLAGQQVGTDTLVGVCLPRTPELVAVLLGILKAGAAYLPIDAHHPPARNAHILRHASPRLILAAASTRAALGESGGVVLVDGQTSPLPPWHAAPAISPAPDCHPAQLAYTLYTSGSTGTPKGVQISRAAFANFLRAMTPVVPMDGNDRLLAVTTLGFDIAGLELFLPLASGARVVIATRDDARDPARLAALMTDHGITVMQATPATWQMLVTQATPAWQGLRVLCGGEALGRELATALLARGADVCNVYGPTETTVWSAAHALAGKGEGMPAWAVAPVGHPLANNQLYVLDARLEPVPADVAGELYIGGAGLARGYAADPSRTAAAFVPNPFPQGSPGAMAGDRLYRTGDLARKRADGIVEFFGRRDHQVKVRGFRVEPGEVEAVLAACPGVQHAVCVARPGPDGMPRLCAYYVGGEEAIDDAILARLREQLPGYMVPSSLTRLDALPLNANGKVDRQALPEPAAAPAAAALSTPTEHALAGVWRAVLGVAQAGGDDDFFLLGGHSLLLVRLQTRIREQLACELALPALFAAPVLRDMAAAIDQAGRRDADADLAFMNDLLETL